LRLSWLGQWGAQMGKPLRIVALIAAAALMFVPGVGNAVGAFIIGSSAAAGGAALLGTIAVGAITAGLGIYGLGALRGAGASLSAFDPKAINADPAAPRKLLLGQTAFPVDLKYAEPSGTDQEFVDYIFALAAHKSTSVDTIYIENDLAWTSAGGAQGKYVGYLTIEVILESGPSAFHTVNAGTTWGSTTRMTGSTTMKVRVKRSANSKSSQSPFSSGIAGRWAVIGTGMPVYDPARDSTVSGGSGSQRANDQTTWLYTASGVTRGNNPALQMLSYLLGWRVGGQISVGVGLPADTLDLASFAVAAALCDEPIALSIGGTQRRFEAGRAFSDADDPLAVIGELLKGMNGELVDDGGRLALRVSVNDLVSPVALTDDDFVSGYSWQPTGPIDQQFTVVRGRYSEPTPTSLYSMVDYPEVAIARTSLAPRPYTLELSVVQDQRRAERIAKQTAQRNLYQGTFNVTVGVRGWQLTRNQVVAVTSNARGWTGKLFRVRAMTFNPDATIELTLREEDASIYAWDRNESAQVTPVPPVVFDSRNAASWLMAGIEAQANLTAPNGSNRVRYSLMEGDQGWDTNFNPSALALSEIFGTFDGKRFFASIATTTAGGQTVVIGQAGAPAGQFPVTPGERLSVQARVDAFNQVASWAFSIWFVRADGSRDQVNVTSGTGQVFSNSSLQQAFVSAPTGGASPVASAYLDLAATSSAAGTMQLAFVEPMVTGAATGQTVYPAFSAGPNAANGADVTLDQDVVSRLDPVTGRASENFVNATTGNPFAQLVASSEARDGDVVTFPSALPAVPRIFFLPGGKSVTADNIRIEASGLSTTGFNMVAKSQTVTAGSTITDGSSTTGGAGEPDRIINRTNSGAPFDGRFTYRFSVTVGNVAPGEPGYAEVALFARKGGNWTEVGRETYNATGTYNRSVTPGTVDFGTGSEFGVSLVYGEGTGTALTGFTHVQYVLGTVTEASLTPSNASPIPWQAFL
jgi:hypothetical protein